jgi:hypothetical protein
MSKYHKNLWKMDPGAQQKTMLKNRPQQIDKCSKNDSQFVSKKWAHFRGGASWGTFGGPIHFLTLKMGPSAPKVLPMIQNWPKNDAKEPQDCEKELQKTSLSGPKKHHETKKRNDATHKHFYDYEKSSPADCAKSDTEGPQKIKTRFQMCICWGPGLADCAERFQ